MAVAAGVESCRDMHVARVMPAAWHARCGGGQVRRQAARQAGAVRVCWRGWRAGSGVAGAVGKAESAAVRRGREVWRGKRQVGE